jgi:hypothetical protein
MIEFPDVSPIAVADGLFVVAATAQIRKWLPRIDGWWAVALVVLLSAGAGMRHAGRPTGTVMEYLAIVGVHTAAVVVMAFGGMEALKSRIAKALATGLPPSIPPPAVLLLVFALAPSLTGCGSLLATSADVANAGAAAGEAAAPIIVERCIEPMQAALQHADVALARATADRCDPAVAAFDLLRSTHVALRAGIVAIASGRMPTDPIALIGDVVDASQAMATAIGSLR